MCPKEELPTFTSIRVGLSLDDVDVLADVEGLEQTEYSLLQQESCVNGRGI